MTVSLTISMWITASNMLMSAALHHAQRTGTKVEIQCVPRSGLPPSTFLLEANGKRGFVDYCDKFEVEPMGREMDLYAKRSVLPQDAATGIVPLGFHFNYSFGLHTLLWRRGFLARQNQTEIIRLLDISGRTGWSHFERRIDHLFRPPADHGGRAIFYTRLWDPLRKSDEAEQERRRRMNTTRIAAVRELRRMGNAIAGIFPDEFSVSACPDLLLTKEEMRTKHYFEQLGRSDIGIANEGLQGSPGWKIGEYVAASKAVITDAILTVTPGFESGRNYLQFADASEIPSLVAALRRDRSYLAMHEANRYYSEQHLHPRVYFARLLEALAGAGAR